MPPKSTAARRLAEVAAGDVDGLALKLQTTRSTLYRWTSGAVRPGPDKQDVIADILNIPPAEWYEWPGQQAEVATVTEDSAQPAQVPAAPVQQEAHNLPSTRLLWEAAHQFRVQLQNKCASSRDILSAISAERQALELLTSSGTQYAELQRVTVTALKEFPAALAACQAAWAAAGL